MEAGGRFGYGPAASPPTSSFRRNSHPIVAPDPSPTAATAVGRAGSSQNLFFRVFPSIMLPMFLAVVDQTIVATALPAIAATMGQVGRASWVVIAYLISNTVAAPIYGQL